MTSIPITNDAHKTILERELHLTAAEWNQLTTLLDHQICSIDKAENMVDAADAVLGEKELTFDLMSDLLHTCRQFLRRAKKEHDSVHDLIFKNNEYEQLRVRMAQKGGAA